MRQHCAAGFAAREGREVRAKSQRLGPIQKGTRLSFMRRRSGYLRLVVLGMICGPGSCLLPLRAQAQGSSIALVRDAQGQDVYINVLPAAPAGRALTGEAAPPLIKSIVRNAAGRLRVDPKLVDAMIRVESAYNPRAVSSKGAMGLMQLIPSTAESLGVENPFDARQNIRGGVTYLRALLDRFNGNVRLSLAAYNAGPNRVAEDGGIPSIPETQRYVRKVTSLYRAAKGSAATPPQAVPDLRPAPIHRYVDGYGVAHFSND